MLGPVTVIADPRPPPPGADHRPRSRRRCLRHVPRLLHDYTVVPAPRIYRLPDRPGKPGGSAAPSPGTSFAVKASAETLPVALREKRRRGAKVVAYLDEWDGALWARMSAGEKFGSLLRHLHHPSTEPWHPFWERRLRHADAVTSTTTFLQRKFGGRILHMGVDTDVFRPSPPGEVRALRESLGLAGRRLLVFGGVVRPHKGVELILDSLVALGDPGVALLVVGPETDHLQALRANPAYAPYLRCAGSQPKERMPDFLSLADAIVLPLRNDLLAQSQMPCKIFEAMAMGKPLIGSAVADLPGVMGGCGWVVPPDDAPAIAERLRWIFAHPDEAARTGEALRARCEEFYSRKVTERVLLELIRELTGWEPSGAPPR
ncbi:MAG: glycosyltransferase family 4 protein [Kiritimatiellia bacterium]